MSKIVLFKWYETEGTDDAEVQNNALTSRVKLKTDTRLSWTEIRSLRPMPRVGEPHPNEPGFFYKKAQFRQLSRLIWEADLEWVRFKLEEQPEDPLARKPKISFDSSSIEIPADRDNRGRMVCNTAGEPLTSIMRQIPTIDYTINVNVGRDKEYIQTHLLAVNSDTVKLRGIVWKPRTLLLASISGGEIQNENDVEFSPYTLKLMGNPLTWSAEVFNTGTLQLMKYEYTVLTGNGSRDKVRYIQVPILEGSPKEPVSEPKPLDEQGRYLENAYQPDRDEPVKRSQLITLRFDIQPEEKFNGILPLK